MRSFTLSIWIITFVMLSLALVPGHTVREQIAYVQRIGNGGVGLYVADVRGENPRRIVNDVASERPAWSPDDTQIAFTGWNAQGVKGIYVVSAEGGKPELLIPNGSLPAWCCPSTQFAVAPGEKLTTTWGVVRNGF